MSLAPDDLADVWFDFRAVGAALGVRDGVEAVIGALRRRLDDLAARTAKLACRPPVAAIEWIDPLMAAANWVPELIHIAGGTSLFATHCHHSPWIDLAMPRGADPDVVVLMPCGFKMAQTLADPPALTGRADWASLSAMRKGRVYAADGHHFSTARAPVWSNPPRSWPSASIRARSTSVMPTPAGGGSAEVVLRRDARPPR